MYPDLDTHVHERNSSTAKSTILLSDQISYDEGYVDMQKAGLYLS